MGRPTSSDNAARLMRAGVPVGFVADYETVPDLLLIGAAELAFDRLIADPAAW